MTVCVFASKNPVSFYKLSLQWPRSACNSGRMNCPNLLPSLYNQIFTIHGIWPQDVNDEQIDPYNLFTHPCTAQNPTDRRQLRNRLSPIYANINRYWPNLKNPLNLQANLQFWGDEWDKHGKCSDYPTDPLKYFESAIQIILNLPQSAFGIQSGATLSVQDISNMIYRLVNARPEIACNRNGITRVLQLWEIRSSSCGTDSGSCSAAVLCRDLDCEDPSPGANSEPQVSSQEPLSHWTKLEKMLLVVQ
ncbi:hypothetical protein V6N13_024185 [Hibiscus sabdariffa]